jgi:hypothetical protein
VTDVGVVALAQQLDDPWHLMVITEHDEAERRDSGSSHVVADIGDGYVKKFADSFVAGGTRIGKGDGKHATVSEE